ncbi:unnamed protein product [Symbiodinium sp. CCMP2592]|nr:unnamed protein product [Symbiodinium sp. CCMP2592]
MMASPPIKSPYHKKARVTADPSDTLEETQLEEPVANQDISAEPKESQGNGAQEGPKLSPVPSSKTDDAPNKKPQDEDKLAEPAKANEAPNKKPRNEDMSTESKESRGNGQEGTKLSPVPHGPKQNDDTVGLCRGDSLVSEFQNAMALGQAKDPVLDMAHTLQASGALEMAVPEGDTCLDMQKSPGKLCDWVYRNGEADTSSRAFEVLKWTRLVVAKYNGAFEAQDSGHGGLARTLHDTSLCMLSLQNEYEAAKTQFLRYSQVILTVGANKKKREQDKNLAQEVLTSKFEQIDNWVSQKLDEKDLSRQEVCKKLDEHIATFSEVLVKLLENTEAEHRSATGSLTEDDEAALCMELENQLNMQLEADDAPAASDAASTSALASPVLVLHVPGTAHRPTPVPGSWQQQGMRAAMHRLDTSELAAQPPKMNEPMKSEPEKEAAVAPTPDEQIVKPAAQTQTKMKAEPREFASEEERQEWEAKEAKRLKHNARVRFDSPDCPQIVLDKLEEIQGQPNRLKTLGVWFQQWLDAGEDWANTQLVIEATRVNEEKFKAKEIMRSYKSLLDQYGKKTADNIRARKYEKEKNRDPKTDPKPYYMPHPDGIDDPARLDAEPRKCCYGRWGFGPYAIAVRRQVAVHGVNHFGVAKKLNVKIQAMAGKLTDIIVWSTKLSESSQKAKDNYQEELDSHRNEFSRIKGELEGLYSVHNNTKDADMAEASKSEIQSLLDRADAATTTFTGAMKPLKLTLEPLRHI